MIIFYMIYLIIGLCSSIYFINNYEEYDQTLKDIKKENPQFEWITLKLVKTMVYPVVTLFWFPLFLKYLWGLWEEVTRGE